MHCTAKRPSHSERESSVPCMRWPPSGLQVVLLLLSELFHDIHPIILFVGEQQRRRV
jgi:hypothetical protein